MNSMTPYEAIQIFIAILGLAIALIPVVKQYTAKGSDQDKANQLRKGKKKKCLKASMKRGRFSAYISWVSEDKKEG